MNRLALPSLALAVVLGCGGEIQPPPLAELSTDGGMDGGGIGDIGAQDVKDGSPDVAEERRPPSSPPARPSCKSGAPGAGDNCGASGDDSCCGVDLVPGGTFLRLDDDGASGQVKANESFPATVSPFWLGRYEITVGRFRQFVSAYDAWRPRVGDGANPNVPNSGWQAGWPLPATANELAQSLTGPTCDSGWAPTNIYWWTPAAGPNENKPLACATWYELFAFCVWDGGRLPTLAEWEFAAFGGMEQRALPWSVPPGSTQIDASYAVYSPDSTMPRAGADNVGIHPIGAAKWGAMDMAGNVFEALLDSTPPTSSGSCQDCALYSPGATYAEIQGGSWAGDDGWLYNVAQNISARSTGTPEVGGRCVY